MMYVPDQDSGPLSRLLKALKVPAPPGFQACWVRVKPENTEVSYYQIEDGSYRYKTVVSPAVPWKVADTLRKLFNLDSKHLAEVTLRFEYDSISSVTFQCELTTVNMEDIINKLKDENEKPNH